MKLLIAYDGSDSSEAALDDLSRAGLPAVGDALVLTVAEVWLPPPGPSDRSIESEYIEAIVARHRKKGERLLNEAEMMAKHAASRVRTALPGWTVNHQPTYGSAGWEILTAADEFCPSLIVVGSHGHSAIGRLILGSISQKVLTEAVCSVRIARGRVEVDPASARILIGFDGSAGANAAVEMVGKRHWPEATEVRVISATDSVVPTAIGRFIPSVAEWAGDVSKAEHKWIEQLAEQAAVILRDSGLSVTAEVLEGNPNEVLVREAEHWHADCIFVGANAVGSRVERFLLGSTSAAVAARAHCSVEVVRRTNV